MEINNGKDAEVWSFVEPVGGEGKGREGARNPPNPIRFAAALGVLCGSHFVLFLPCFVAPLYFISDLTLSPSWAPFYDAH